jgi:hypothetical protein
VALLLAVALAVGTASAKRANAATTIAVDCTANPSALANALAIASNGDTLAIQGTCVGVFDLAQSLTLIGSGGATLDAQGAGTVLTIESGQTEAVTHLRITGGSGLVAGIRNKGGTLTLTNSTVDANNATVGQFQNGVGGILNQGGSVTLANSMVSGNSASAVAPFDTAVGGIFNSAPGSIMLAGSTVSGNTASTPSDAFGGILNSAPGSVVTLTNSTVSGNSASAPGGPTAFSMAAGGISNSGGSLTLTSGTVSGNNVSEPNGGFLPPVGGIGNFFGGTLTVGNSLIAGQSGGPNCVGLGTTSDGGYNLDDGASCSFSMANHSLSNTNPLLDPAGLKNNGGPTQTIALLPGSPAIDPIPNGVNGCGTTITTDQRGITRPQGSGCDIGAYELVPAPKDTTPPVTTITFPRDSTFNALQWKSGCRLPGFCGKASDPDSPVQEVEFSLQRISSGKYWNGSGFESLTPMLLAANGTSEWSVAFPFSNFRRSGSYRLQVRGTDPAGNVEQPHGVTFTIK